MLVATLLTTPAAGQVRGDPTPGNDLEQHQATRVVAFFSQFLPSSVTIKQGESLTFGNYDPTWWGMDGHSLDEVVPNCTAPPYTGNNAPHSGTACRYPRFSSGLVDHGYAKRVWGVESLPPGTYDFLCMVHPAMRGRLIVS
jgi:plastocyanin